MSRFILDGKQVNYLVKDDLPVVARALQSSLRGKGLVAVDYVNHVPIVHLEGQGYNVYIRGEDWAKILPYLADGTLSPLVVATAKMVSPDYRWEPGNIDIRDRDFFNRILSLLETLFTEQYPT